VIEEQAHVLAIAPGRAWVQTIRRSACGSCGTSSACGTATVAKLFSERTNHLEVVDRIGVAIGDQVVIGISDGTLTRASLLAYLLPLVALMLAAFAARSAGMSEEAGALIGILGLCTGLWVAERLARGAPGRGRFQPVLLRRVTGPWVGIVGPRRIGGPG